MFKFGGKAGFLYKGKKIGTRAIKGDASLDQTGLFFFGRHRFKIFHLLGKKRTGNGFFLFESSIRCLSL